jgi:hypothetical protein
MVPAVAGLAPRRYNGRYNGSGAAEEAVQRKLPGVA